MKLLTVVLAVLVSSTAFSAELPVTIGTVVHVKTEDPGRDESYNQSLHFCLFENGKHDLLYVGTKAGMWSKGWIELTIKGKMAFSGNVPALTYGGVIIDLGDVLEKQPDSNVGQYITTIKGRLK